MIPTMDAFEEGNMDNILDTIKANISFKPSVAKHKFLERLIL